MDGRMSDGSELTLDVKCESCKKETPHEWDPGFFRRLDNITGQSPTHKALTCRECGSTYHMPKQEFYDAALNTAYIADNGGQKTQDELSEHPSH